MNLKRNLADFSAYLVESWHEVKPRGGKVTWPTWEQTKASSAVVVVTSIIVMAYLALVDFVLGGTMGWVLGTGGR